jgi:hypothetical protein
VDNLLIPVSLLATKLGKTLTLGSAQFSQAELAIWTVSVRARSAAGKTVADWPGFAGDSDDSDTPTPDAVKVVVLEAAYRVFKNPQRYVMNQVLQFTGQISNELDGDVFLRAERDELERFQVNAGMWTVTTTRRSNIFDDTGYVAVEGSSQSFPLYGPGEG